MAKRSLRHTGEAGVHTQKSPQRRVRRYTGYNPYSRTVSYMASKFSTGAPA